MDTGITNFFHLYKEFDLLIKILNLNDRLEI